MIYLGISLYSWIFFKMRSGSSPGSIMTASSVSGQAYSHLCDSRQMLLVLSKHTWVFLLLALTVRLAYIIVQWVYGAIMIFSSGVWFRLFGRWCSWLLMKVSPHCGFKIFSKLQAYCILYFNLKQHSIWKRLFLSRHDVSYFLNTEQQR